MHKLLSEKIKEAAGSVLPISAVVVLAAFTPLTDFTAGELVMFIICAILLIIGIALFNMGADAAMTTMGKHIGAGLVKNGSLKVLLIVGFVMGILITVAEPDLSVLASQVSAVINSVSLIAAVSLGVGLFLLAALLRLVFNVTLSSILMISYMLLFALCALLTEQGKLIFIPLSFDSGGVTTGPLTVPFIMALGLGIASSIGGHNSNENSFGFIALCSVGPMLAVMLLSLFSNGTLTYTLPDYSMKFDAVGILETLAETAAEVFAALALIVICFMILQVFLLKLPKNHILKISLGLILTFLGLVIFLSAATAGFLPAGFKLGNSLANGNFILFVIFAFVLGLLTVLAEPAVLILNRQIEEITGGAVTRKSMMASLSLGVGIALLLSAVRSVYGFSILYYLVPGYFISLLLSLFVPKLYTAIAFDSGGVASGPLTSCFILPFFIGACVTLKGEGEVLNFAFGVVAMVAMTPLITIQCLGFKAIADRALKEKIMMKRILDADDEQIIYF